MLLHVNGKMDFSALVVGYSVELVERQTIFSKFLKSSHSSNCSVRIFSL